MLPSCWDSHMRIFMKNAYRHEYRLFHFFIIWVVKFIYSLGWQDEIFLHYTLLSIHIQSFRYSIFNTSLLNIFFLSVATLKHLSLHTSYVYVCVLCQNGNRASHHQMTRYLYLYISSALGWVSDIGQWVIYTVDIWLRFSLILTVLWLFPLEATKHLI